MKSLHVWFDDRLVGLLVQTDSGQLAFTYDFTWLEDGATPPISRSLPKRDAPFSQNECIPFFDGLLPEGGQRNLIALIHGVSKNNAYSLLEAIGGEVAGALTFLPLALRPEPKTTAVGAGGEALSAEALYQALEKLPRRPFLTGEGGLRLSLAGAQSKLPVYMVEGKEHLPSAKQLSTHILKPAIPKLRGSTENEAFIMRLAAAMGLPAPRVEPRVARLEDKEPRPYLLVARYDRHPGPSGRVERLHQEDFCQALGIPSQLKYQREGGPNLPQCFDLVRSFSVQPAADAKHLQDVVIFNVLVGNADAHGKNFSILYTPNGPRLAPFYDLMSTAVFPELDNDFAMKIGGQGVFRRLGYRAWRTFCEEAGLNFSILRKRLATMAKKLPAASVQVMKGLASPDLDQAALQDLARLVCLRADLTIKQIRDTPTDSGDVDA